MMKDMVINQTRSRENKIDDSDLFDTTIGYDEEVGIRLTPGLSEADIGLANMLYHLFNELWGVCVVKGDPGAGKDLFGNWLAYTIKRLFPTKRILRDEKPRWLFGEYAALFNDQVLSDELRKMRAVAKGDIAEDEDAGGYLKALEKAADQWVTKEGMVLLKHSLLYLTEYWRYCYNRNPHDPMNKTMGGIHKEKRHLDCLIVGTVQLTTELDKKTCLPWIDWQVTCTRSASNKTGFIYYVQKVKYERRIDVLVPYGRITTIPVDAGKPRSYLGDGKIHLKKSDYEPENEEERIVLDVIKAGYDTYDGIVGLLESDGDMSEREVLDTLKELSFRKNKRVIDYACFYRIYNSKSAPQMKTAIRVEE